MHFRKSEIVMLGTVLLAILVGIYVYPHMPEKIASHWNIKGEVDGYLPKFWGLFIMPSLLFVIGLLFYFIPRIDPLKTNIEQFRKQYDTFVILLFPFLLSIHIQIILWIKGFQISPSVLVPIGLGILFFYVGILFENAKQNWFIGIRTPWTLSSENVWEKTHKLGAKLFKVIAVITVSGIFFGKYTFLFVIIPVLFVALYTIVYSYVEYRKEVK